MSVTRHPEPLFDEQEQAAPVDWQDVVKRRERELKQVGEARHRAETERDQLRRERDGINRMYLTAMGDLGIAVNRLDHIRALAVQCRDHSAAGIDDYQIGRHDLAVDVLTALDEPAPAATQATDTQEQP